MLTIPIITVLQIVFLVHLLFGILILVDQKRYRGLLYLLSLMAALLTFNMLEENGITKDIYLITPVFSLLCGPLFYWFIFRLLIKHAEPKRHHYLHLIPAFLALPFTSWPQWILFFGTFSQLGYVIACLRLVRRYHNTAENRTAQCIGYRIDFIKRLLILVISIGVIDLIRLNLQPYLSIHVAQSWYFATQMVYFLMYSSLIAYSIRRPELFDDIEESDLQNDLSLINTAISESEQTIANNLFRDLERQIYDAQLYLQPRLTLRSIAEHTGLNERDISRAINIGGQQSFNDYINKLRVNTFIKRLKNRLPNQTILELAYECGFNSKSSFNAVFKRLQGVTPSQFLKSIN